MKDKIDTLKKWFKPFLTTKNIIALTLSVVFIIIIILLGVLVW